MYDVGTEMAVKRTTEQVIRSLDNDPARQATYIAERVTALRRKEEELMAMAVSELVRELALMSADIAGETPPVSEGF